MKNIHDNIHWLLRLPIALTFVLHGYPKLGSSVADLGYVGYLVGPFELFGAILIILGPFVNEILTRIGSAMIAIIMAGAIYMHLIKWNDGWLDIEWQVLLLCVSVYFLVKGDS